MNKTDLASDEMIAEVRKRYRNSGYPLLFVSAAQKEGVEAIREYLRGKTTTVAGPVSYTHLVSTANRQKQDFCSCFWASGTPTDFLWQD